MATPPTSITSQGTKVYFRRSLAPSGYAHGEALAKAVLEGGPEESLTAMVGALLNELNTATGAGRTYATATLDALLTRIDDAIRVMKRGGIRITSEARTPEFFEKLAGLENWEDLHIPQKEKK